MIETNFELPYYANISNLNNDFLRNSNGTDREENYILWLTSLVACVDWN